MSLLEHLKGRAEKATGLGRPGRANSLVRDRKARPFRFAYDGLIPNHPYWPLIIYRSAVRLPKGVDPAAVFEDLFEDNGWGDSWRDGIYPYVHYHSRIHEVLGIARGRGQVQFGGPHGRMMEVRRGDVAILPAGTGHASIRDRKTALQTIPSVRMPRKDPVYGKGGPLTQLWRGRRG